ncbi:putative enzyme of the cupin superfamily [Hoeflea sp. IMCC20628]|uniref:cupin domain-containing protein n=1 Tax=Hoeflea sp. IMCC20628 TaxID=1620421 RepID=UPI00063B0642|nr:cupin domain-containing protein [Hoeflea sp. IMCC20628]AKI01031.1 putative enzyme of the cupin superfamily [Hoeflea sp. IMCC20628]
MATPNFIRVSPSVEPEVSRPEPEKVLAGDPVHTTWNLEERDGLYCGIWQSTPGTWRISYDEWEYCHILEGISVISEDGGEAVTVKAGDSFILLPGFKGSWQVIETTRKDYVIRL